MIARKISKEFKEDGIDKSYDEIFSLICRNMEIQIKEQRFVYFIDTDYLMDTTRGMPYENLSPAYEKILGFGLKQLKYPEAEITNEFCISYNKTLDSMSELADRIIVRLKECRFDMDRQIKWFDSYFTSFFHFV